MKDKHHVFLESRISLENLSFKQLEDFEFIIGTLNETLKSMYGCAICYDCEDDETVNGFAILVKEDSQEEQ